VVKRNPPAFGRLEAELSNVIVSKDAIELYVIETYGSRFWAMAIKTV
jgi:hypothetical protein